MKGAGTAATATAAGGLLLLLRREERVAPTNTRLCLWPDGPDHENLVAWEDHLGRRVMYRERGGRGRLDSELLKRPEDFYVRRGSFDLQSRTGTGSDGTTAPVPFQDIVSGRYDGRLDVYVAQVKDLVVHGSQKHWLEFQSECNVVNAEQPGPEWNPGGPDALAYVRKYFRRAGVRRRDLKIGISVTASVFRTKKQDDYLREPLDRDITDFLGVDGYSHQAKPWTFEELFDPMREYAVAAGKPWAICEAGVSYNRALWYSAAKAYLLGIPPAERPKWVMLSTTSDNGPRTVSELEAFTDLASIFR